ncbi:hypothetical protein GCM10009677_03660 [Sphaerisporangium rubeum]|uniref:Secreted protein n=1 Tax=Sphaerisporangium rubeum TaxID=321317 RepID=A0A7X0I8Y3_9ACTN|nr:hypothetical protein [Sphaerisporangium rubeum]MBB6470790.1 hypothetical protein [Sphaerisporangium rubeum]
MSTPAKLAACVLGLVLVFGGTFWAGRLAGPAAEPRPAAATGHAGSGGPHGAGDAAAGNPAKDTPVPAGLQVSQDGYTLVPLDTALTPGETTGFRFTVTGADGRPVTAYEVAHGKKLHLIVVPRDLGGFQHLHPELGPGGVWSVPLTLPAPGAYRMFADFVPEGATGLTLGADLYAPGDYRPGTPPDTGRRVTVDGYTVTLDGDLTAGRTSRLTLTVSRDGRPVTDLEPYLGSYGHLVALRGGDLAYLHVHPAPGGPGPAVAFDAEVPSGGSYRLFLDFKHNGAVRTAAFTVSADGTMSVAPEETGDHGH